MLGIEKRMKAMYGDVPGAEKYDTDPLAKAKSAGETAKLGFVLGALAILLAIGFYVAQDMKMQRLASDVNAKVDAVSSPTKELQDMNARLGGMEGRVAALESFPAQAKKAMLGAYAGELSARAGQLGDMAGTPELQARAKQIQDMLDQFKSDVAK